MTVVTGDARRGGDATVQPVPWRRMAWVTWRQHRLAFACLVAAVGTGGLYLLAGGLQIHDARSALASCHPPGSPVCRQAVLHFQTTYGPAFTGTLDFLQLLPALVGAFIGAPLLARELETGTFRYAWTQGFGRTRWTVAKLGALGGAAVLVAGAFSALVSWYSQPMTSLNLVGSFDVMDPPLFELLGVAFPTWTLAAFAIGALAGVLIRRVVPAMLATVAAWAGLAILTAAFLRQRYQAPLTTPVNPDSPSGFVPAHGLTVGWEWARGGKPVSLSTVSQALRPLHLKAVYPFSFEATGSTHPPAVNPYHYLQQHGFVLLAIYQPDSRFWAFQSIEAGWLLALSLLLLAATVWLVRRRAA